MTLYMLVSNEAQEAQHISSLVYFTWSSPVGIHHGPALRAFLGLTLSLVRVSEHVVVSVLGAHLGYGSFHSQRQHVVLVGVVVGTLLHL